MAYWVRALLLLLSLVMPSAQDVTQLVTEGRPALGGQYGPEAEWKVLVVGESHPASLTAPDEEKGGVCGGEELLCREFVAAIPEFFRFPTFVEPRLPLSRLSRTHSGP